MSTSMSSDHLRSDPAIYLAVIGPSAADDTIRGLAEDAGQRIAEAGAVLVTGGLDGAMEAACRGAKSAGGATLGILPGSSRAEANPYVDYSIPTGMGEMRNALVVRSADGIVAVGGGYGTLSELALALKLGKPVVGVASWSALGHEGPADIPAAESADEAVQAVLDLVKAQLLRS